MKQIRYKVLKKIANLSMVVAIMAAGTASFWEDINPKNQKCKMEESKNGKYI